MVMTKRILVNYTGRTKGAPVFSYEMTKGLLENGAEVYAVVSAQANNIEEWRKLPLKQLIEVQTYTNKREFIYRSLMFYLWGRRKLLHKLQNVQFDAVYCPMVTLWTRMINRLLPRVPLFFTVNDPTPHEGESLLNKYLLGYNTAAEVRRSKKVVLLTETFRNEVQKKYGKSSEDIVVIPHGIFDYDKKADTSLPALFEKRSGHTTFLLFGRIEAYKGIDTLLEAYRQVENTVENTQLVIAGDGDFSSYYNRFKQLHTATLINRNIKDEEVSSLFLGSRIVTVLPYRNASQSGIVNIAAMHRSLIIATEVGALPEQLGNGEFGVLLPPQNVPALVSAMLDAVNNYEQFREKIQCARTYMEQFTWGNLAKKLLAEI